MVNKKPIDRTDCNKLVALVGGDIGEEERCFAGTTEIRN